eukprot:gene13757-9851_t
MSSLDDKISQIMSGNFIINREGGGSDNVRDLLPSGPSRMNSTRPSIPTSVSTRLQSNSDDDEEIVEHPTYDDVYNSLSDPIPPRDSYRANQQQQQPQLPQKTDVPASTLDPFQQTVNLQLEKPAAVQVISSPVDNAPSPVGDSRDDGHDLSFLGVAENSGDIPYELSVSDAQDHTFTVDDLAAANDIAKNLSIALDAKSVESSPAKPKSVVTSRDSPARPGKSSIPSSPASKAQVSKQPPSSNPRGNSTPQKAAPTTPSRSGVSQSASRNPSTPGSGMITPVRGQERSRAASPDCTVASNANDRVIRLAARVRPMNSSEQGKRARRSISKVGNDIVVVNPNSFQAEPDTIAAAAIAVNNSEWAHAFNFDHCLWSYDIATHTEDIYDQPSIHEQLGLEMVESVLNGVNVSCFVYGHSGSGKTYTLFGGPDPSSQALTRTSSSSSNNNKRTTSPSPHQSRAHSARKMVVIPETALQLTPQSGLVPRVFHDIVRTIKDNMVSMRESRIFFSYYMIYNDMVVDLLTEPPSEPPREDQQDTLDALRVREHPVYGPYVENLKRVEVFAVEDVFRLIAEGDAHRAFIQTAWHLSGSRYHAIASLDLTAADLNEILRVDPNRRVLLDHHNAAQQSSNIQQAIAQSLAMSGTSHATTATTNNVGSNNTLPFRIEGEQFRHDGSGRVIKIQMIDLAGSESEATTTANTNGDHAASSTAAHAHDEQVWSGSNYMDTTPNRRLKQAMDRDKKEMRSIRQSLTTLGFIIQSLAKGAATKSLPYRDATLTFLLRDCLNGYQHTTLIGTISPAHTQFDETLSTLRYLEKFNLLMMHRRRVAAGPHSNQAVPLGLSISKAALKEPRAVLIDNFRKFHSDLDVNHKGSVMQRQLLKETVADPQQRIAKLTRGSTEPSISVYSQPSPGGGPFTPARGGGGGGGGGGVGSLNMTFTSPIDGSLRRLRDITAEDLDHLQSSYRDLQSRVLELQIDFDAVRTDRDTLMVELRATRERLQELEDDRDQAHYKTQNVHKALKNYEKEVLELRGQLRRREEENDRLLSDLTEQKQARQGSEQAYHARTKEFLQRFDSVTKEKKALQAALELASHKDSLFTNEKNDLVAHLTRLKAELEQHVRTIEDQSIEIRVLRQDVHVLKEVAEVKDVLEHEKRDLEQDRHELLLKLDGLVQDHQELCNERDSLVAMLKQKDSLLWLQSQQSEASIKMLQQRQQALERAATDAATGGGGSGGTGAGDFQKLLDSLRELFDREGQVFTAADGSAALMDTATLITLIRELKEKIVLFDRIEQEFHALEARYQHETQLRQQADDKFYDLSRSLQSAEMSNAELSKQLVEVHRELEAMKRVKATTAAASAASAAELPRSPSQYYHHSHHSSSMAANSFRMATNAATATSVEITELQTLNRHLQERVDQLVDENQRLVAQSLTAQKEAQTAREEVTATQNTMQREFASLWMSVQELNKLDALKDKSIQELIHERTQLTLERDTAVERLRATTVECETLRKELDDVDADLQRAVGMDHRLLHRQGLALPPTAAAPSMASSPTGTCSSSSSSSLAAQPVPSMSQATPMSLQGSTMVPVMMVPQQALSQMMLQQQQQPPQSAQAPPPPPFPVYQNGRSDAGHGGGSSSSSNNNGGGAGGGGGGRSLGRTGRLRYRNEGDDDDDDDGLREEILMHQIEELTGFLHDEERLKRVRIAKNTPSPPATQAAAFRHHQQQQQQQQQAPPAAMMPMGLFTPQQSGQKLTARDLSAQRGRPAAAVSVSQPSAMSSNNSHHSFSASQQHQQQQQQQQRSTTPSQSRRYY